MKQCEVCNKEIPEDYQNLLCDDCYKKNEIENERLRKLAEVESPPQPQDTITHQPVISGIADPNYKERPQTEDKPQWLANLAMFERNGVVLWPPTRGMYTFIKNWCLEGIKKHPQYPKFIWRPKIVDVGCGIGCGSNILSQEADFVWGIDNNEKTIMFAKEAFTRVKNGIYYSSQISFDIVDIMEDTREFMKFDVVAVIEVIEHIDDYKKFLSNVIKRFDARRPETPTTYFISTPNRNNKHIGQETPKNPFHVREWTSEEFHGILSEFFSEIIFRNSNGDLIEGYSTTHTPLLAQCKGVKI